MKKFYLFVFVAFVLSSTNLFAQEKILLEGVERKQIEEKILNSSKNINTLQANFIQEQTSMLLNEKSISTGILLYKTKNLLRWEYLTPKPMALVLNNDEIWLINESGLSSNDKMFKHLANLIVSTINGEGMSDSKNFQTVYYIDFDDSNTVYAKLIPINKRIKAVYHSIQIKIQTDDYLASEIVLEDRNGDKTTIILSDKKINLEIDETQFEITSN